MFYLLVAWLAKDILHFGSNVKVPANENLHHIMLEHVYMIISYYYTEAVTLLRLDLFEFKNIFSRIFDWIKYQKQMKYTDITCHFESSS